jgi:hypothetical protein
MIDPAEAAELVQRDTELGLAEAFQPTEGFVVVSLAAREGFGDADVSSDPVTNGQVTAVAWRWFGEHNGRTANLPYAPTGRSVTVDGLTVVTEDDDGEPRFHRYVDWLSTLAQIGVTLTDRPVYDEPAALGSIDALLPDAEDR